MIDKWRTLVALAIIYMAVVMNWQWVWGLLFIMWTGPRALFGPHNSGRNRRPGR